jgi:hypothetical protein
MKTVLLADSIAPAGEVNPEVYRKELTTGKS